VRQGRRLVPGDGPLARVSPVLAFLVVAAVFAVGVVVGGVLGAVLLFALAALVGLLVAATWSRLSGPERVLRAVVLLVLLAVALSVLR
jgi:uncharacterized membrane protein YfcA